MSFKSLTELIQVMIVTDSKDDTSVSEPVGQISAEDSSERLAPEQGFLRWFTVHVTSDYKY
jgi:hypothetical protein